jgi:hypothetical protein
MVCMLEQQKTEHWKAVTATMVLATEEASLKILDGVAFVESFDANADHHEVAERKPSTLAEDESLTWTLQALVPDEFHSWVMQHGFWNRGFPSSGT